MDYLDPIKKHQHRIRLYIGYGLLTVAVAIATVILVYIGNGFYVDRSTGDLIQNGQFFVNSDPDGATIYLNGRQQRPKTPGRLVVPSGIYNVSIKRDGYRDWQASNVLLEGGTVERLDYARLLPTTLTPTAVQTFANSPYAVSESTDRHYITLQFSDHPLSVFVMDLTKPESAPMEVILPKTLFSDPAKIGQLQLTEWADDNKHFIIKNMVDGVAQEFIIVNRENPDQSVNLTRELHLGVTEVTLHDRAYDNYYVFDAAAKTLSTVDLSDKNLKVKINDVVYYKTYGSDYILYITAAAPADKGKMQARLDVDGKSYLMREVPESPAYLLAIAKLGNAPVLAIGVQNENKVTILRDPLTYLKANPRQLLPLPTTVLQVKSPTEVSFSTDVTTAMARGGQNFASHNFDLDKTSKFVLPAPTSNTPIQWVDGKHMTAVSGGAVQMFDFSGENLQKMVPSLENLGVFFDNSYQSTYTFTADQNGKVFNVNRTLLTAKNL